MPPLDPAAAGAYLRPMQTDARQRDQQATRPPRRVDLDIFEALGGQPDQVRRAAELHPDDLRAFVRWYARRRSVNAPA